MRRPVLGLVLCGLVMGSAFAASGAARERAIEQIPELMGRILESQEQIRARESALVPVVESYDKVLTTKRRAIEKASTETEAAEALVDYIEAYAARLDEQHAALTSIQSPVVRMRADARELINVAETAKGHRETPEERQTFFQDHFQGIASATGELAERLERTEEASTTGAVLHASWASHGALDVPIPELGPEGAIAFARKVEGLYARVQARTNQLRAERRAVRRLLDVLIERQLARRLDTLFAGNEAFGLAALLSPEGKSQDWQDLGSLVSRTLGLPAGGGGNATPTATASLDRLDYFARGGHRRGGSGR